VNVLEIVLILAILVGALVKIIVLDAQQNAKIVLVFVKELALLLVEKLVV